MAIETPPHSDEIGHGKQQHSPGLFVLTPANKNSPIRDQRDNTSSGVSRAEESHQPGTPLWIFRRLRTLSGPLERCRWLT